jgi:CBS-domain-containing membrane protein
VSEIGEARLLLARQEIDAALDRLADDGDVDAHDLDKFLVDLELELVHRRAEIA